MKKRFSIVMIAAMLCMCIPVIGPPAYAEEGDPMQEPVYMEDGESVQETADAESFIHGSKRAHSSEITPVNEEFTVCFLYFKWHIVDKVFH